MTPESGPITTLESMPSDPDDIRGWLGTLSDAQLKRVCVASALTLAVESGMDLRGVQPLRLLLTEVRDRFCACDTAPRQAPSIMAPRPRSCVCCGVEFTQRHGREKYCSQGCKRRAKAMLKKQRVAA